MLKRFIYFLFFIFHFSLINAQSWLWGRFGIGEGEVSSVATDVQGNCYFSGLFTNDTLYFGSFYLPNSAPYGNEDDVFLVKYSPAGNVIWAKQTINKATYNTAATSLPASISTNDFGNIYLNGNFPDSLIIGTYTLIVNHRSLWTAATFLAKYDSSGNVLWAKQSLCTNDSSGIGGKCISANSTGDCFVGGAFTDTIKFDTQTISTPSPSIIYAFIVKYDSSGNVKWAKQATGNTIYGSTTYGVASDILMLS